jgi:hypothetical protein
VGDTWTYRVVNRLDQAERQSVTRVTALDGDQVRYANGNVGDLAGNNIRIVRSADRVEYFDPSNQFYLFPMKVGSTWNLEGLQKFGDRAWDMKVRLTVIADEEIEVPAGKMRALKIQREARWKERGDTDNAGVNSWTYWYNAKVKRFVLAEVTNTTTKGKVIQSERYELSSFEVK